MLDICVELKNALLIQVVIVSEQIQLHQILTDPFHVTLIVVAQLT